MHRPKQNTPALCNFITMTAKNILFTLSMCLAMQCAAQQENTKPVKIIYVYDALCGWCYGFSPVMQKLNDNHPEIAVEVVSGGMITGDRMGPLIEVAPYIRSAYKDVELATGVEFGQPFLDELFGDAQMYMTSVPAAKAMAAFRIMKPDGNQLAFAGRIQTAVYSEGMHPDHEDGFAELAKEFGLNKVRFLEVMRSDDAAKAADADMQRSSKLGVTGFPTVFLEQGSELLTIARGYLNYNRLEQALQRAITP